MEDAMHKEPKRKVDSDSESHPNPAPKKISPLASAPASSSSSSSSSSSDTSLYAQLATLKAEVESLDAFRGLVTARLGNHYKLIGDINRRLDTHENRLKEHWVRMDYLSDRIDTTAIKSGDVAVRVAKCEKRLDDAGH